MNRWSKLALDILRANHGTLRHPYRLFLVVTKSCGSKCRNCNIWLEKIENELSLDEYTQLAKKTPWLKWLNISGGEPTDREDLPQIISVFKKYCPDLVFVNFTTNALNGQRVLDHISKIASLNFLKFHVNVSIDGPPETNDYIRGVKGNFQKSIDLLREIRKIKNITCSVAFTVFEKNQFLINETFDAIRTRIPDFAASDFHFNLPHVSSHFYGNDHLKLKHVSTSMEQVNLFLQTHPRSLSSLSIIENMYRRLSVKYIQSGRTPIPCSAMKSSVYVSEKGVVYPCTIWDKPLGNLREVHYDLMSILNRTESLAAKDAIEKLKCPNCWTPCEAFPSIMTNLKQAILS